MAGKKASKSGVGKAEVVYGNRHVVSAAKSTKVAKDPYYKEVGGAVVGKKSGGRLDKMPRGKK